MALGVNGNWNCLEGFSNISNISQNGLSLITSDPSRVCLCNETGQPDCLTLVDPTPHSIYPGQSLTSLQWLWVKNLGQLLDLCMHSFCRDQPLRTLQS